MEVDAWLKIEYSSQPPQPLRGWVEVVEVGINEAHTRSKERRLPCPKAGRFWRLSTVSTKISRQLRKKKRRDVS
jgi:hypothetical protein